MIVFSFFSDTSSRRSRANYLPTTCQLPAIIAFSHSMGAHIYTLYIFDNQENIKFANICICQNLFVILQRKMNK